MENTYNREQYTMLLCVLDFKLESAGIYCVKAQLKSDPSPWLPYMEVCTQNGRGSM
jgi:hypothetical protein